MDAVKDGVADRLKEVLDERDENANSLAGLLNKANSNIYKLLDKKEKHLPNVRLIIEILNLWPEYSYRWFLTGHGPKFIKDEQYDHPLDDFTSVCKLVDQIDSLISAKKESKWKNYKNCLLSTFSKHMHQSGSDKDVYNAINSLKDDFSRLQDKLA